MIEVQDLRKTYGDLVAVDGVSFTAEPGRIFGLLGPNGAGKSTTINCISGLLKPTSGRVCVLGHDVVDEAMATKTSPPPITSRTGAPPTGSAATT